MVPQENALLQWFSSDLHISISLSLRARRRGNPRYLDWQEANHTFTFVIANEVPACAGEKQSMSFFKNLKSVLSNAYSTVAE
jgi:hypothetical protein